MVGIREDNLSIIVVQPSCNVIKMRAPQIIVQEQNGLCKTSPINILFNMGERCLIDPLEKGGADFLYSV